MMRQLQKKVDGGQVTKRELNKTKLCDWICEEREYRLLCKV